MYVSSTAPIQDSMSPLSPVKAARYNARKQRVFVSVARAASNYACAAPASSFPFGYNFQNQVQRSIDLLNHLGTNLTLPQAQKGATSTGTSGAPKVVPLNPVDTNPKPKQYLTYPGPFDTPLWGDSGVQWPGICTPGTSILNWLQSNPWWALGGLAAVALAGGVFTVGVKRRRARRRRA